MIKITFGNIKKVIIFSRVFGFITYFLFVAAYGDLCCIFSSFCIYWDFLLNLSRCSNWGFLSDLFCLGFLLYLSICCICWVVFLKVILLIYSIGIAFYFSLCCIFWLLFLFSWLFFHFFLLVDDIEFFCFFLLVATECFTLCFACWCYWKFKFLTIVLDAYWTFFTRNYWMFLTFLLLVVATEFLNMFSPCW